MDELPEPLVPADCDLRGYHFMPLDVVRLLDSSLFARSTGEEFKAAVALWCKSWTQIPAGSLPDDDRDLAYLSGAGTRWSKIKAVALMHWIKCNDGRLYHPVVAEKAVEGWKARQAQRARTEAARQARAALRQSTQMRNETNATTSVTTSVTGVSTNNVTTSVTDNVTGSKGQGQGQGQDREERKNSPLRHPLIPELPTAAASPPPDERRLRASRLPPDWQPSAGDDAFARSLRLDPARILASFRDYWTAKSGADATKLDWSATWRNWCRREAERGGKPLDQSGGAPSAANPTGRPVSLVSGAL